MDSSVSPALMSASQNGAINPALIPILAQLLQAQQSPNALTSGQTLTQPAPGSSSVPSTPEGQMQSRESQDLAFHGAPTAPPAGQYGVNTSGFSMPPPQMSSGDLMALQQGISQLVKTLQTQAPPTAPVNTIPAPTATPLPTITPYTPIAATPGTVPQVIPPSFTAVPQVTPSSLSPVPQTSSGPAVKSYVAPSYDPVAYQMPQGSTPVASATPSTGIRTDVNQATPVSNPPSIPVVQASSPQAPQSNALGGLSQQLARSNLPSAPGTVGSYGTVGGTMGGGTPGAMNLGTLSDANIAGASDASMASAMSDAAGSAGGGMGAGAISGVVSGIQGIGQGIGQMFKGVTLPQLQIPPMAPMSNFSSPLMT